MAKEFSKLREKGSVEFYSSEEILGELARVLTYQKIEQVFKKAGINKTTALESIIEILKTVNPKVKVDAVKSDPLDNKVLECALEAGANYVASGDRHLLELRRFRKIEILTAREFLEETSSSS